MSSIITNPHYKLPKNKKSHTKGWTDIWADHLHCKVNYNCDAEIIQHEKVYIDHGVNFGGTLNLFGGANKDIFDKFNRLMQCPKVVSLDCPMPDFGEMLKKRIGSKTTHEGITEEWCERLSEFCNNCGFLNQEQLITNKRGITIGDSHSLAFSKPEDAVLKRNGRTLEGALKKGIYNYIEPLPRTEKVITLSLGSIDIRHHIMRSSDPKLLLTQMLEDYISQVKYTEEELGVKIEIAAPVPVEHEKRKVPKSGWFEGTPFYGSQEERSELTKLFINYVNGKHSFVCCPMEWYYEEPEEYAKRCMELTSSVHLSPTHYRRNLWGRRT